MATSPLRVDRYNRRPVYRPKYDVATGESPADDSGIGFACRGCPIDGFVRAWYSNEAFDDAR